MGQPAHYNIQDEVVRALGFGCIGIGIPLFFGGAGENPTAEEQTQTPSRDNQPDTRRHAEPSGGCRAPEKVVEMVEVEPGIYEYPKE